MSEAFTHSHRVSMSNRSAAYAHSHHLEIYRKRTVIISIVMLRHSKPIGGVPGMFWVPRTVTRLHSLDMLTEAGGELRGDACMIRMKAPETWDMFILKGKADCCMQI